MVRATRRRLFHENHGTRYRPGPLLARRGLARLVRLRENRPGQRLGIVTVLVALQDFGRFVFHGSPCLFACAGLRQCRGRQALGRRRGVGVTESCRCLRERQLEKLEN